MSMTTSPDIAQDICLLDELSGLAMAMARDLQAAALAASDASEKTDLALAFQRTARSVRQTIALKAKLERDHVQAAREVREAAAEACEVRRKTRQVEIRRGVERVLWDEGDEEDAEFMLMEVDGLIERAALDADFETAPVATQIARLCEELGVARPANACSAGGKGDGPHEPLRQSSA